MTKYSKLLLSLLLILLSCGVQAKTYRIGLMMPLTGPAAGKGIPMKHAVELFIEEYNKTAKEHGGVKLELVVKDDSDDSEKAKVVATELVRDESIVAVIGNYYPATAVATAKIFNDAKIPVISPYAAPKEMFDINKYAFSLNVTEEVEGAYMAVYIKEVLKKDNVLLIYNTGLRGEDLKQAFMDKAIRIGLNVVKTLPAIQEPKDQEWAAKNLPDSAENAKFGVVAALTRSETGVELLPQIRARGIAAAVLATSSWTSEKFLAMDEKYTADVYVTSPFLWGIANEKASVFRRAFEKKYTDRARVPDALAYDSILLLSKAIESLEQAKGPPSRASVHTFLANLDWQEAIEGITGMLYFQNKHDRTAEYVAKYHAALKAAAKPAEKTPDSAGTAKAASGEGRSLERDLFVSVMEHGRLKVAPIQFVKPREEFALKDLAGQVKNGRMSIVDSVPYHMIDVVFVGIDIVRINDVNIKDMQWDADVFMWFKWTSGRIEIKDIEKIGAINAVKEQSALFKEDMSRPTKYRAYKKRLTLGTPFNLAAFPFDSQTLKMSIAHTNKDSSQVMLVLDSRHMENAPIRDIKPQEWTYEGRDFYSDLYRYDSTFGDPDYRLFKGYKSPIYFSTVNLNVDIKRMLQPYIFTFFLPLTIILGIILLILWVPLDQFAPRINASISGLVGVLVYHMSQKNAFPKVGYTMFADYYFLIAYIFVVATIFSLLRVQMMMSAGLKDQAKVVNRRIAIGALITTTNVDPSMTLSAMYFGL